MTKSNDIAVGHFIESWPAWLRWLLFLPASFLGAVVASVLYLIITAIAGFFVGFDGEFITQLISSAVLGGMFIYAGAWMAPHHQFAVSIFLLVLLTMVSTLVFLFSFSPLSSNGPILQGIHTLVVLIMGGAVVFHVKNEETQSTNDKIDSNVVQ